jgi:3-oxoacyl-[acyl-carrier protein] reductase
MADIDITRALSLSGKRAVVTGASRGIGRAIAERFVALGAEVWGVSTREPTDLQERLSNAQGRLHWQPLDLSATDTLDAAVDALVKDSGGFDIVVNDAGITRDNLSLRMPVADFEAVLRVNLTAAFIVARVTARDMLRRRRGSIINMASVVGIHGNGGQANYAAAKAGLIAVTKSLAAELASRSIRVNAIAPGFIDTDMTAAMTDAAREKTIAAIPMRRMGTPADIANLACFLAGDDSAYITGQVIPVDGGMFL